MPNLWQPPLASSNRMIEGRSTGDEGDSHTDAELSRTRELLAEEITENE